MRSAARSLRTSRPPAAGGFTLLEVVVALVILAAGILAVIDLFSGSLRLSEGARDVWAAQVYASQRMEEALLSPNPLPGVERGAFGEKFRWETRTTQEETAEYDPYREIRIRVIISWDDGLREKAVELAGSRWERRRTGEEG